jgi:transcription elongation factor Elf1
VEQKHLDRKYDCPACPKEFRSRHALRTHVHRIHEAAPLACPICAADFTTKRALRIHAQIEH